MELAGFTRRYRLDDVTLSLDGMHDVLCGELAGDVRDTASEIDVHVRGARDCSDRVLNSPFAMIACHPSDGKAEIGFLNGPVLVVGWVGLVEGGCWW